MDEYKKLKPEDWAWLKKFNRVVTGRASKAECDELGVPEAMRLELYNARYARRQDTFSKGRIPTFHENSVHSDPSEQIIEIIEIRRTNVVKLPLRKSESPNAPSPAKLYRRG